jgi:hypothetical protein
VNPRLTLLLLSLLVLGCDDSSGPGEDEPGVPREWVTGAAAQALDASGHFIFDPMPAAAGELSREQAAAVANAFFTTLRNSVGNLKEALEEQHGRAIDFAALTMCGRVIPVSAPFLPSPLRPEAQYARNLMAARYAFEFCEGTQAKAVGLEVAVTAGVTVAHDGTLQFPDFPIIYGNEFLVFGIPARLQFGPNIVLGLWALTPEAAVKALYLRVHTPVQTVPRATGCMWAVTPCQAKGARHWRLETAEPVAIRRQGSPAEELAQVFYVQIGESAGAQEAGGVYVPSLVQPPPVNDIREFPDHAVVDTLLLALAEPLAMDSFTVAGE